MTGFVHCDTTLLTSLQLTVLNTVNTFKTATKQENSYVSTNQNHLTMEPFVHIATGG